MERVMTQVEDRVVGLLFPGQGVQEVGMGRSFREADADAREMLRKADQVLGYELTRLCMEGPAEQLTRADRAQPAICVVSVMALNAVLRRIPQLKPVCAAGLSSGEWAALHAAGVVGFEDALRILQARGRFMQEACEATSGGMTSIIGLPAEKVVEICRATGVQAANFNSPLQTVISGPLERLPAAEKAAREAGARRVIRLRVAGAFHSELMRPAAEKLRGLIAEVEFREPRFPVVSNVTGLPHGTPDEIRELMVRQVYEPVKWVDCMRWMLSQGVKDYLECGPGRVLAGLAKGIDKTVRVLNIPDHSALETAASAFSQ